MFRASSALLQEDTVVYMQHMVLSLSTRVRGVLRHPPTTFPLQSVLTQAVYRQATTNSRREWWYHMLHVYNCIRLKMSTWGSKHIEENSILWINNNQCIKLVINIENVYGLFHCAKCSRCSRGDMISLSHKFMNLNYNINYVSLLSAASNQYSTPATYTALHKVLENWRISPSPETKCHGV